jgi:hypothetical protein
MRSKENDKGLNELLRGEVEKGEKETSPSPSIGHQTWNIPLATKLWIYLHLPSPSLEKATRIIRGFSLEKRNFLLKYGENFFSHPFLVREEWVVLSRW